MLSIGKLAPGRQEYYLDTVAAGVEDYYTGSGEAPGQWYGSGSERLGLAGEVAAADLQAVLDGQDPRTGEPLGRAPGKSRVPGFDLTFCAPKSVSILFALGGPEAALAGPGSARSRGRLGASAARSRDVRGAPWPRRGTGVGG